MVFSKPQSLEASLKRNVVAFIENDECYTLLMTQEALRTSRRGSLRVDLCDKDHNRTVVCLCVTVTHQT